jgi:hypothetical protein
VEPTDTNPDIASQDDGVGEIEGEQNDNDKDDGGKTGDDIKKVGGKVVGGITGESKEDDDDATKGTKNVVPIGKKVENIYRN